MQPLQGEPKAEKEEVVPSCPKCGDNRQVWKNQISGKWTCHRAFCDTVIEEQAAARGAVPADFVEWLKTREADSYSCGLLVRDALAMLSAAHQQVAAAPQKPKDGAMITTEHVRAAGGIVHSDGNIFFTNIEKLNAACAPLLERIADLERHTARLEALCQSGADAKTQVSALLARLARQQEQLMALTAELTHHRQANQSWVPSRFLPD